MRDAHQGAVRVEITDADQWHVGDVEILQNQEARTAQQLGSLLFRAPLPYGYEAS